MTILRGLEARIPPSGLARRVSSDGVASFLASIVAALLFVDAVSLAMWNGRPQPLRLTPSHGADVAVAPPFRALLSGGVVFADLLARRPFLAVPGAVSAGVLPAIQIGFTATTEGNGPATGLAPLLGVTPIPFATSTARPGAQSVLTVNPSTTLLPGALPSVATPLAASALSTSPATAPSASTPTGTTAIAPATTVTVPSVTTTLTTVATTRPTVTTTTVTVPSLTTVITVATTVPLTTVTLPPVTTTTVKLPAVTTTTVTLPPVTTTSVTLPPVTTTTVTLAPVTTTTVTLPPVTTTTVTLPPVTLLP